MEGVHCSVQKGIDVGAFVIPCEQVVQSPQIDIALFILTKRVVPVIVLYNRSELCVA